MNEQKKPIIIDYYSDLLCIWAWIAQPRLEEIQRQWGPQVIVQHRYVDVFGNAREKIPRQWGEADGYEKFQTHVVNSAAPFDHISVHPDLWSVIRPRTSMISHLTLKAVGLVAGEERLEEMAKTVRQRFFADGRDIGQLGELLDIASELDVDIDRLKIALEDGSAMAALSQDQRSASEKGIKGSPTWVLNDGRQLLYGNVGYRILNANIEELLKHPVDEASWC